MDAQLRGLDGKLEKSLAAQAELEHRQQQITAELNKGWEPAARYEELKLRLSSLNRELTKAGVEIEASPELSNLGEEAFRPVESCVSVHQILSLTEQSVETGEENVVDVDDQIPIASEFSENGSGLAIAVAADLQPAQSDKSADGAYTKAVAEGNHARSATSAKRGATSKSATGRGAFQQMCFNWS